MQLKFSKMHGLGNDFMVVDGVTQKVFFSKELIKRLGDRNLGVGFDQLLLVEPPYKPDQDFHYRIFNLDGSEVQMCGNGARCFARFVVDHGLCNKREIKVSTISGDLVLKLEDDGEVTVNMGVPVLNPERIPFKAEQQAAFYDLPLSNLPNSEKLPCDMVKVGAVSMGNPHCVLKVDDTASFPVELFGPVMEPHPMFPEKVNVGFMQVINDHEIKLRVYERGCGETLACGSGACAAVVVGIVQGYLNAEQKVTVHLKHGDLHISWKGEGRPVMMKGPVAHVFEGMIEI